MMAISNHAVEDMRASDCLPVPGNRRTPTRVTAKRDNSYLHAGPPMAGGCCNVGERNHEFDVYKIAAAGGDEIRLTTGAGTGRRPEFTPDGAYISSTRRAAVGCRSGGMRPDGSARSRSRTTASTTGSRNISPDGKWIAYIRLYRGRCRRTIILLQARAAAIDAAGWWPGARHRLPVWWSGNDQRPVLGAGRQATGVRE